MGDDAAQLVRFYLYSDALAELIFAAESSDDAFAILRGNFGVDDDGGFVEVSGFSDFQTFRPDADPYPAVRKACDGVILTAAGITRPEDAVLTAPAAPPESGAIVGLFVAQAGSDATMDEAMARLHYSLFNVPFQAIVVFDKTTRKLALFGRPPRGRFENLAFRWVMPSQSA